MCTPRPVHLVLSHGNVKGCMCADMCSKMKQENLFNFI